MANANWNGGHAKSRAQARAWLAHNERDRRADPQVSHANREIDQSRTHLNYEVGPTAAMTYGEKCARLDARLEEFGYPLDADLGANSRLAKTCLQGIVVYPPDALVDGEQADDDALRAFFEAVADLSADRFGAENIIAAYVDRDEVHDYTDAVTGEVRMAKPHMHLYVVPVVDAPQVQRVPIYVRPDGTETLNADEAERVFLTRQNAETDDPSQAAEDENGEPLTGPRCARVKSGRRKYKKVKPDANAPVTRKLQGSEFSSAARISAFNSAVHQMTRERFGLQWNMHEPGTYQRDADAKNKTVEQLKAESFAREAAQQVEKVDALVRTAEATLGDAQANAEAMTKQADEAKRERDDAAREMQTIRKRNAELAGDVYDGGDGKRYYGTKGLRGQIAKLSGERRNLTKLNAELEEQNKAAEVKHAELLAENERLQRQNATQANALKQREAEAKDREDELDARERTVANAERDARSVRDSADDYARRRRAQADEAASKVTDRVRSSLSDRLYDLVGYHAVELLGSILSGVADVCDKHDVRFAKSNELVSGTIRRAATLLNGLQHLEGDKGWYVRVGAQQAMREKLVVHFERQAKYEALTYFDEPSEQQQAAPKPDNYDYPSW